MTYPFDPNYRPQREADPGLTTAAWASVAFVLLLFGGVAIWAYYSDNATTTASVKQPGIEQSAPPTTTGQGGAASKMSTKDGAQ
jgi:hypothetical protein